MEHDYLWMLFDGLITCRPFGQVTLVKVKAHKSIDDAADHAERLCCHYNALADAAAKKAVKQSQLASFTKLQTLHGINGFLKNLVLSDHVERPEAGLAAEAQGENGAACFPLEALGAKLQTNDRSVSLTAWDPFKLHFLFNLQ